MRAINGYMTNLIYKLFYGQPLSKIIFFMILLVFAWAKLGQWFVSRLSKERLWQIGNAVCWFCMVFVILSITISSRSSGAADVQWKPFYSFEAAKQQPEIYRSMLMNVFLFFPLGLTLPYALPEKWKCKELIVIVLAVGLSVGVEYLQYHFCLGRAETDDVICNTLGCVIGTLSYKLGKKGVLREDSGI